MPWTGVAGGRGRGRGRVFLVEKLKPLCQRNHHILYSKECFISPPLDKTPDFTRDGTCVPQCGSMSWTGWAFRHTLLTTTINILFGEWFCSQYLHASTAWQCGSEGNERADILTGNSNTYSTCDWDTECGYSKAAVSTLYSASPYGFHVYFPCAPWPFTAN